MEFTNIRNIKLSCFGVLEDLDVFGHLLPPGREREKR
jgi:hypothetical protein